MLLLERIAPFFVLVVLGALLARCGLLDRAANKGLSRYVYWLAFPALLIHTLAGTSAPGAEEVPALVVYAVSLACPYLLTLVIGRFRGWSREARAAAPLAAGAPNDAFLGAPLLLAVLGSTIGRYTGPLVALNWALLVPAGLMILQRGAEGRPWRASLISALLNPVTLAALIGVALIYAHRGSGPPVVQDTLAALAASSSPVALVALGASVGLADGRSNRGDLEPVIVAIALRLVVAPALVYAAMTGLGSPRELRIAATVLAASPTAVTVFIQAEAADAFAAGAAKVVAISTLLSAVTLTAILIMLTG